MFKWLALLTLYLGLLASNLNPEARYKFSDITSNKMVAQFAPKGYNGIIYSSNFKEFPI
jgi:hypothetical protein